MIDETVAMSSLDSFLCEVLEEWDYDPEWHGDEISFKAEHWASRYTTIVQPISDQGLIVFNIPAIKQAGTHRVWFANCQTKWFAWCDRMSLLRYIERTGNVSIDTRTGVPSFMKRGKK